MLQIDPINDFLNMRWKHRPSHRELETKIAQAKIALAAGRYSFGFQVDKLVDEFAELKIGSSEEIWPLLRELLEEVQVKDYAGPHPPLKSIESNLQCELYIFVWDSKKMGKKMYLKFAIKNEIFYYVSLHKSNRPEKCWKFVDNFQKLKR